MLEHNRRSFPFHMVVNSNSIVAYVRHDRYLRFQGFSRLRLVKGRDGCIGHVPSLISHLTLSMNGMVSPFAGLAGLHWTVVPFGALYCCHHPQR